MAAEFEALDAGSAGSGGLGVNWNNLIGGAFKAYADIETIKATKPDQTPVAATSPVQVATPHTGIPITWIAGGAVLLIGVLLLRKG